jgi:type I restriction-modification system DNA methylase subunit
MGLPKDIENLIDRFDRNRETYRSGTYNEAQLRQDFLNPLLGALGWDMTNKAGYAEAYRDVIHEDAIKIGGATKAPDYCFRIGSVKKFFVEAKKPSVNLKDDVSPAFQLRRYAWSAKLPLSILTDFEEFAVYDCRIKPVQTDKASTGRVLYFTYKDYPAKWDELVNIFSREAVLKGSFDKYAESSKLKKGTATVDDAFLTEIEDWRDMLAKNIALRNTDLTTRELNFAVQRTIDRIVFLRICEDRGIEEYGRLQMQLNGTNVYKRLVQLFSQADDRYNSGLFHFQREKERHEEPDKLTPNISIDDKPLKDIINRLYYPESPYEFSVLSADILGQVYEQFLGKVIRLTAGHQAKVEEKPEVRKAGGVYYTPKYIVDYIVKNTVGKLVEDKKPKEVEKLTILDPACGSGSFLLGAYQYLLDWHLKWYIENEPDKWAKTKQPSIYQGPSPDPHTPNWNLTTSEKKRILLNNIYGVDIDSQAVEVTKLSLLLKVLEGENNQTLANQLRMFHERALPDLGDNIKCGNSLVGPDFYQQQTMLDDEERYRVNVFDWDKEFTEITKAGGFDAVIGNPPYIRSQSLGEEMRKYYSQDYRTATATYDIYVLFVERGVSLLKDKGRLGFILPNKFFTTDYGEGLRGLLTDNNLIDHIVDFEDAQIFKGAGTYTNLLLLQKRKDSPICHYAHLGAMYKNEGTRGLSQMLDDGSFDFDPIELAHGGQRWTIAVGAGGNLLTRLQSELPLLKSIGPHCFQGLKTSADKLYMVTRQSKKGNICKVTNGLNETIEIEQAILRPVVKGEHVKRYVTDRSAQLYIIYPYSVDSNGQAKLIASDVLQNDYPLTWAYFKSKKQILGDRDRGTWSSRPDWYAYARGQNIATFIGRKILLPYMTTRLRADLDEDEDLFFVNITTGGYGLRFENAEDHDLKYILGLLNSKLLDNFIRQMTNAFRGGYFAVNKQAIERLPFRPINFNEAQDKTRHNKIVSLVDQMLSLNKQLPATKTDHEKTAIQRQINAVDQQIDQVIYALYGLNEDEIKLVEGNVA